MNKQEVQKSIRNREDFLQHYGILGMKWGVRKEDKAQKNWEKQSNIKKVTSKKMKELMSDPEFQKKTRAIIDTATKEEKKRSKDGEFNRKRAETDATIKIGSEINKKWNNDPEMTSPNGKSRYAMVPSYDTNRDAYLQGAILTKIGKAAKHSSLDEEEVIKIDLFYKIDQDNTLREATPKGETNIIEDKVAHTLDLFKGEVFDILNSEDFLEHYGVLGMKWGVRTDPVTGRKMPKKEYKKLKKQRKQEEKQKSGKGSEDYQEVQQIKKKRLADMSNDEVQKLVRRMQLEKQYKDSSEHPGKKMVQDILKESAKDTSKKYVTKATTAGLDKAFEAALKAAMKG